MTNDKRMNDKTVIIIDEKPDVIPGQPEGEVPVITIEDGGSPQTAQPAQMWRGRKWPTLVAAAIVAIMVCVCGFGGWKVYRYFYDFGVPVGISPSQNLEKLERTSATKSVKGRIEVTSDSILGVAMTFYKIDNLKAEIVLSPPDTADTSLMLSTRCADFTAEGQYLGSLVVDGRVLQTDRSRAGYCAMANGNVVIGVSRSEKLKDYCAERGGAFFRQFVLVSDGVLPSRFVLHGKVERRALARMSDDSIWFVETRHKETLWDFADALREYGFVDAIYITGRSNRSWYRSDDGAIHHIGAGDESTNVTNTKATVPWLVFKCK